VCEPRHDRPAVPALQVDIGTAIREVFDDELDLEEDFPLAPFPPSVESYANRYRESSKSRMQRSEEWFERAEFRKQRIDEYLWNESKSLYFDYDTVAEKQILYESVTAFWALWAGCASEDQCWKLVSVVLFLSLTLLLINWDLLIS
jgi:alpha,alpha-trehalase